MKLLIEENLWDESGIYIISNSINEKVYIGSAVNFKKRFIGHKNQFVKNKHNTRFQNFVNKYGLGTLSFQALEVVKKKESLILREQHYIDFYESYKSKKGFNICPKAGSSLGAKMPESHKISNRKRMLGNKINLGRKTPENVKKKISESMKGREFLDEWRETLSKSRKGINPWSRIPHPMLGKFGKDNPNYKREVTQEFRENMSKIRMGEKNPRYGYEPTKEERDNLVKKLGKKLGQFDFEDNLIKTWDSARQAGKSLKIDGSTISKVARGEIKKYKGFVWKYI